MDVIIDFKNVSKSFGHHPVLNKVDLSIPSGEIFGLIGPSGSGKTTLIKIFIGLESLSAGEVSFKGEEIKAIPFYKKIGYMAQSDALYEELTAYENLQFFASIYGLKKKERKQRIEEVMKTVDLLDHLKKPVHLYSGGMKRRLSLAIALLHDPEVLILDEPTVGIDPVLRKEIWAQFQKLKKHGRTLLITTHVMDEAERCDRLALLRDGKIIANEKPESITESFQVSSIEEVFLKSEVSNI
ncbi:ABC-2 type transport system ATP-binding protein [Bacillus pakistanensis]|uniref:ABC-2 type transport system ATP-binding protein n=1 Tax=Rossellomorea pakistanensis TaxID=992288 RepID=A0ABS2NBI6_9BACI|nr:ABC transporter ATP-binding protein [Bacillus pakistanensis]MBM7585180.1 ABC-2 type transport system ATP-binding protein [Bacillus pakistanensis]